MRFRERQSENERRSPQPEDEAAADERQRLQHAGETFLAAGDEAIRRALSGDSEGFVRASRQQGGQ
jgi:hypothetical protein